MVDRVKSCDGQTLHDVSRSFANFLALANSAENHHRIRKLKTSLLSENAQFGLSPKLDSCGGSISDLIKKKGIDAKKLINSLHNQTVEIVLTAHPTEVNRKTMLTKLNHVKHILDQSDRPDLTNYDKKLLYQQLNADIASIWNSDFLRRRKPTPVMEARTGLDVVENVLWRAVPNFLRKLDDISRSELKQPLSLNFAPIKLASWMGGDRDGNPNVTPEVTLAVSMMSRNLAATLLKADMSELKAQLSVDHCSDEMRALVGDKREPYRELLQGLEARLQATIDWTEPYLTNSTDKSNDIRTGAHVKDTATPPLKVTKELMEPLLLMHRSLEETGLGALADGALADTIRRVAAFGLSLMPLDIRQESTRHSEALDAITKFLGVGSYLQWDEAERRRWLQQELQSKRPLLPRNFRYEDHQGIFTPTVVDTLRTFEVAASLEDGSFGAYVISQCQQASDILAVVLLQQDAGVTPRLRVAPLFETLDDLERSEDTVEALFGMPVYRELIAGKQEIMVGYSDSAKVLLHADPVP